MSMIAISIHALALALLGQAAGGGKADPNLDYMKSVASSYRFALDGDRSGPLRLGPEPSFRMGKQSADDVMDGAMFFWSGEQGRPEAVAQVFQVKNSNDPGGHWVQE